MTMDCSVSAGTSTTQNLQQRLREQHGIVRDKGKKQVDCCEIVSSLCEMNILQLSTVQSSSHKDLYNTTEVNLQYVGGGFHKILPLREK